MERLKQLLKEKKIKQKELSKILNLSESTISLYISGEREPDLATLSKLANFFDVTIDYLIGKSNFQNNNFNSSENQENTVRIIGRNGVMKEYKVTEEQRKAFETLLSTTTNDDNLKY